MDELQALYIRREIAGHVAVTASKLSTAHDMSQTLYDDQWSVIRSPEPP